MTKKSDIELYEFLANSEHTVDDNGIKKISLKSMDGISSELWFIGEMDIKYVRKKLPNFKPRINYPEYLDKLKDYQKKSDNEGNEFSWSDFQQDFIDNHNIDWCAPKNELLGSNYTIRLEEDKKDTQFGEDYHDNMFEPIVCLPSDELARDLMGFVKRRERKKIEKEFRKRLLFEKDVSLF